MQLSLFSFIELTFTLGTLLAQHAVACQILFRF